MARIGGCHEESAQNKVKMKFDSVSRFEDLLQGICLHKSNFLLSVSSESIFLWQNKQDLSPGGYKEVACTDIFMEAEARNT